MPFDWNPESELLMSSSYGILNLNFQIWDMIGIYKEHC